MVVLTEAPNRFNALLGAARAANDEAIAAHPELLDAESWIVTAQVQFDGMAVTVQGTPAQGDQFDVTPATADLSLFDTLDRVVAELKLPNRSSAQVAQTVASGLRDVDAAFGSLQMQRALAGESLNRIDAVESRIADVKLGADTERAHAEDLDMVQALSDFQAKQTGYEAALSTYSLVQKMSLFKYL